MNLKIQILTENTLMSRLHVGFEIELPLVEVSSSSAFKKSVILRNDTNIVIDSLKVIGNKTKGTLNIFSKLIQTNTFCGVNILLTGSIKT